MAAPWSRKFGSAAWLSRWLHTYTSLVGFATLIFFSLTGLTLNHAGYFEGGDLVERTVEGLLDVSWCAPEGEPEDVDELRIVESLRHDHGLRGRVQEFETDRDLIFVVFQGAGYVADVQIDRGTGAFDGLETASGFWVVVNDLHKGRGTGVAWSWVIDVSAIVLLVAGVTGIWLLLYVRKRRSLGLWTAVAGTLVLLVVYMAAERT